MTPDYSLSWILPFVRQSLQGCGDFSYDNFIWGLWPELEKAGVPGVVKTPPERMYSNQPYRCACGVIHDSQAFNVWPTGEHKTDTVKYVCPTTDQHLEVE